jgi:hypothetical protein
MVNMSDPNDEINERFAILAGWSRITNVKSKWAWTPPPYYRSKSGAYRQPHKRHPNFCQDIGQVFVAINAMPAPAAAAISEGVARRCGGVGALVVASALDWCLETLHYAGISTPETK